MPHLQLPAGTRIPSSPEGAGRTPFERQVRDALAHLTNYPRLRVHLLARYARAELGNARADPGLALHNRLLGAIDALTPAAGVADREMQRRHLVLPRRYAEGGDARAVQAGLAISPRPTTATTSGRWRRWRRCWPSAGASAGPTSRVGRAQRRASPPP
jgi:hypothetical protein